MSAKIILWLILRVIHIVAVTTLEASLMGGRCTLVNFASSKEVLDRSCS